MKASGAQNNSGMIKQPQKTQAEPRYSKEFYYKLTQSQTAPISTRGSNSVQKHHSGKKG